MDQRDSSLNQSSSSCGTQINIVGEINITSGTELLMCLKGNRKKFHNCYGRIIKFLSLNIR